MGDTNKLNRLIKIFILILFSAFMFIPFFTNGSEQNKIAYGVLLLVSVSVPSLLLWYIFKKSGKSFSENLDFAKNILDNAPYDDEEDLFNYSKGYYEDE